MAERDVDDPSARVQRTRRLTPVLQVVLGIVLAVAIPMAGAWLVGVGTVLACNMIGPDDEYACIMPMLFGVAVGAVAGLALLAYVGTRIGLELWWVPAMLSVAALAGMVFGMVGLTFWLGLFVGVLVATPLAVGRAE